MDPLTARVADRFKDRVTSSFKEASTPSQAALAFLTKSAKGIKGGFDVEALKEALPLIGWNIEEVVVAAQIDGEKASGQMKALFTKHGLGKHTRFSGGGLHDESRLYLDYAEEDKAKALFADIKALVKETTNPKGPTSLGLGELAVRNLDFYQQEPDPVHPSLAPKDHPWGKPLPGTERRRHEGQRWIIAFNEAWFGVTGWTVTTPKGSVTFTPKMTYYGALEPTIEKGPERFWTFAYKAGLKDLATTFLNNMGADVVENILKPVDPRTLQNTGACPACFTNVKLIKGRISRHGWSVSGRRQRGVHGLTWHTGPCFGVGYEPFEVSEVGTKDYLKIAVLPALEQATNRIARLKARPETLTVEIYRGKVEEIGQDHKDYERYLKIQTGQAEATKKAIEEEREMLERLIGAWEPRALPGTPGWKPLKLG